MFNLLTIDNPNNDIAPAPKKQKTQPAATVSKPPDSNDVDFLDFVPIDNNSDDFDIANILKDIENQNELVPTPKTQAIATNNSEKAIVPNTTTNTTITNTPIQNVQQNNPVIPRMILNNSTVTINYNFTK